MASNFDAWASGPDALPPLQCRNLPWAYVRELVRVHPRALAADEDTAKALLDSVLSVRAKLVALVGAADADQVQGAMQAEMQAAVDELGIPREATG